MVRWCLDIGIAVAVSASPDTDRPGFYRRKAGPAQAMWNGLQLSPSHGAIGRRSSRFQKVYRSCRHSAPKISAHTQPDKSSKSVRNFITDNIIIGRLRFGFKEENRPRGIKMCYPPCHCRPTALLCIWGRYILYHEEMTGPDFSLFYNTDI